MDDDKHRPPIDDSLPPVALPKMKYLRISDIPPGLIQRFAALAFNDPQICLVLNIDQKTLKRLKKAPKWRQNWQNGEQHAAPLVERSLLQRALGYTVENVILEARPIIPARGNVPGVYLAPSDVARLGTALVETRRETRHIPADVEAAKFWLTNRDPERWRVKTESVVEGAVSIRELVNRSIPELQAFRARVLEARRRSGRTLLLQRGEGEGEN